MSDFDWEELDDKYADIESEEVAFSDTLYGFDCPNCGSEVWSESFDPDADGPSWAYNCHDCEMRYRMYVSQVTITGYEEE